MAIKREDVAFYSEGVKLWGRLCLPEGYALGQRRPAVVNLVGFTGTYDYKGSSADLGDRLAREGYVTLGFDYRGFGRSEGAHRIVNPLMQVRDVQNAITYLQTRPEVDPNRIALWGRSLGAGIACYTGAVDRRIGAVVSYAAVADGHRWLRHLIPGPEWQDLMQAVEVDRRARVLGNAPPKTIAAYDIARKRRADYVAENADDEKLGHIGGEILLESAQTIAAFSAESVINQMTGRPILFVHAQSDATVPPDHTRSLYEKCGEPKALWLIPADWSKGHYGMFKGQNDPSENTPWARLTRPIVRWLKEVFPVNEAPNLGVVRGAFRVD
ncbi:MAG: alpha/beta fold hydrolase [Alphaproteobacteria bacterium]|nr:alpha/beta fold hydrolase [Alphaproteobacteria bacterium]